MEFWSVILLVMLALVALGIIIRLAVAAIAGAGLLLVFASEQGFVGLAAYAAAWVFLFPVMLVVSIIIGFFVMWNEYQTDRKERALTERQRLGYDD